MSEQKLVSPLLDGFQMGAPISGHDGVRCCPAIKENSDNKYIVKILSIPASQNQLDALLLAGAFQDAAGALDYFKDLADGVVKEVKLHQHLARLDGFIPCDAWQVVPMDDNQLGYEIYLLTPYHRTLNRHLKKTPLTHLEAVNLGLDLCAALSASRRAGFLYVDLKPSNVFIASDREFLIGDLGFISMNSLKYAALPSKYRSVYTAPEMADDFATISDTADVYALGLILYQVYNDGQLPVMPEDNGPMAAPANADYEMAEIILKACAFQPADRWQTPAEMGQALVAYMQRNRVTDKPIVSPDLIPVEEEAPEAEEEIVEEEITEEVTEEIAEVTEESTEEEAAEASVETEEETVEVTEETAEEETSEEITEESAEEETSEEITEETAEEETSEEITEETAEEETSEEITEETAEEEASEENTEESAEEESEPAEETVEEAEPQEESSVAEELAFIEALESEEADAEEETEIVLEEGEISDETSAILAQVEELVAHEIPDPVVVTAPQLPEEEEPPVEEPVAQPAEQDEEDEDDEDNDEVEIPIALPDLKTVRKAGKKWLALIAILCLLAGLVGAGCHYYENYYLIPVDSIVLDGDCEVITARIDVSCDESKITAVCTDTYGNTATSAVTNGYARFTGLNPGTQYTVTLRSEGFNKFTGNNSATFTTDQQTKIVSFTATTGAEDGDVILSLTVDGFDPQNWTVEYAAEGKDAQSVTFSGHMVTLNGLTVNAPYTFKLSPAEETDIEVVGETTLDFTVSPVILAQNVSIGSFEDGTLTVVWDAPADSQVSAWTIRCTGDGYDQTITVSDPSAQFSGVEMGTVYTVEILADGMTQSNRTELSATPLSMSGLEATMVSDSAMRVTWAYTGDAPSAGWSVSYSINSGKTVETLACDSNAADLSLVIPDASYEITVIGVDTDVSDTITYKTPAADKYTGNGFTSGGMSYSMCVTPSGSSWTHEDVTKFGSPFPANKSLSMVVYAEENVSASSEKIQVLYVVRDASGKALSELCSVRTMKWDSMWNDRYFYATLDKGPSQAGKYAFEVYFNGELALKRNFTIE